MSLFMPLLDFNQAGVVLRTWKTAPAYEKARDAINEIRVTKAAK
jgi:hypothetical protein